MKGRDIAPQRLKKHRPQEGIAANLLVEHSSRSAGEHDFEAVPVEGPSGVQGVLLGPA